MISKNLRWMAATVLATNMAVVTPSTLLAAPNDRGYNRPPADAALSYQTTTPIKHIVVIFQENVSFDHYFGTYPNASNPSGESKFKARANTPTVNGLSSTGIVELNQNPTKPFRLDPSQNYTCDQNHDYGPEQQAFDSGLMDKFPEFTGTACTATYPAVQGYGTGVVMGYYDGNTVTGLWNYAQHFALDDNMFDTNFGPSTPGAINVVSGMTGNADPNATTANALSDGDVIVANGAEAVVGDPDPWYDDCSGTEKVGMLAKNENIGTLLSAKKISWGWFQGGFTPSSHTGTTAVCATTTNRIDGTPETAYSAHHNPFQYYAATANQHHTPPASLSEIGHDGPANHQYDLSYFWQAAVAGKLPAVSYLKPPRANDAHPANSSPLDEQAFITDTINKLQSLPSWDSTAVIVTYDDSDGWFDHAMSPIINQSTTSEDALTGSMSCGTGVTSLEGIQGRCGYGPRLPFLVVSSYAKDNFVDHSLLDQSSVVAFIEDNWGLPRIGNGSFDAFAGSILNMFNFNNQRDELLFLNTSTGEVVADTK